MSVKSSSTHRRIAAILSHLGDARGDVIQTYTSGQSGSVWRTVACASWDDSSDPRIFVKELLDVSGLQDHLSILGQKCGQKITLSCFFTWLTARCLAQNPAANMVVRARKPIPLPDIVLGVAVALPDSDIMWTVRLQVSPQCIDDLAQFATLYNCELAKCLEPSALRALKDDLLNQQKIASLLPAAVLNRVLRLCTTACTDWGLPLQRLGINTTPFLPVSAAVTCPGMFGLDEGFAAFTPLQPSSLIVMFGEARMRPYVVDGSVSARLCVKVCPML
eukprot:TRINITY_DN3852_c0_g4_i1.p1 TRINITY_DN3852_c0_g4~~TRINITY_DN3852_c0_g4_i1.p1  ORF type:complete len:276 (+),score=44.86 TRINITY_DN3852_c0_g4_i1:102-929(+)